MSATMREGSSKRHRPTSRPREDDPRVVRTRAAVVEAARELFLRNGYAGTTMEDVAAAAGLAKRTLYNNYADKDALFVLVIEDVVAFAEDFARGVREEFAAGPTAGNLRAALNDLARRLAVGVVRREVVALRRLLIGEASRFPDLAASYFDRAPDRVLKALASDFEHLHRLGLLRVPDGPVAAAQFAYLVLGAPLDHAMLTGVIPPEARLVAYAREGVETFLARYAPTETPPSPGIAS